jgi:hypothetical protein
MPMVWSRFSKSLERPVAIVPGSVLVALAVSLCLQIGTQLLQPKPSARAQALSQPPTSATLAAVALGEPIVLAQMLTLYLQAFDNQPGISIPFLQLDYSKVTAWLETILALDPRGQYPLLLASQVYSQVPDAARQRSACDFVSRQFAVDPDRRWRWLAHCAIMAKHRLRDTRLALSYAEAITRQSRHASNWARQMHIFLLEDLGEREAATILLGGLLASGEVTDPKEIHFLAEKLEQLKTDGKSSYPSESRHLAPRYP